MKTIPQKRQSTKIILTEFSGYKGEAVKQGKRLEYDSFEHVHQNHFKNHRGAQSKEDANLFSFAEYRTDPAHRKDSEVVALYALTLDIDNQTTDAQGVKKIVEDPITLKNVGATLRNAGLEFSGYTSYRHNTPLPEFNDAKVPKARVIVPFDGPLEPIYLETAFNMIHELFDFHPGIDGCGKKISQAYFEPSCSSKNKRLAKSAYNPGKPLSVEVIKKRYQEKNTERKCSPVKPRPMSKIKPLNLGRNFNLKEWILSNGMTINKEKHEEGQAIYEVTICPMNPDHTDCSAAFGQRPDGTVWFRCHHDGCSEHGINEVIQSLDPSLADFSYGSFEKQINTINDSPSGIGSVLERLSRAGLSEIENEKILKEIGSSCGVTLGSLRKDFAQSKKDNSLATTDTEMITNHVIENYNFENIIFSHGNFWVWKDRGIWEKLEPKAIRKEINQSCRLNGVGIEKPIVDSIYDTLGTECFIQDHSFNQGDDVLNFINTEISLNHENNEWEHSPHKRERYSITQIPVIIDSRAKAQRFLQFLDEIFAGDPDAEQKKLLLLEIIGYCFLTSSEYEKYFIFVGPGANGKSVFLGILCFILGTENICAIGPKQLDVRFYRAQLHGKLANIVTEIPEGEQLPEAPIKAIVSGELLTVDHKNKPLFNFRPYSTLVFAANQLPYTRDYSDGMSRRTVIVEFNNSFKGDACDPFLLDKLKLEAPGIVNLALEALKGVIKRGDFTIPNSSDAAKADWRLENDQVAEFVAERCIVVADCKTEAEKKKIAQHSVKSSDVYFKYELWADEQGIRLKIGHKALTRRLRRFGVVPVKSSEGGKRLLQGIKLKPGL